MCSDSWGRYKRLNRGSILSLDSNSIHFESTFESTSESTTLKALNVSNPSFLFDSAIYPQCVANGLPTHPLSGPAIDRTVLVKFIAKTLSLIELGHALDIFR